MRRKITLDNDEGFTIVEVLVSLFVAGILIIVATTITSTATSINKRTDVESRVNEAVFNKLQGYVNTEFENIPRGDSGNNFEVEDFTEEVSSLNLSNLAAKAYVKPASQVSTSVTSTVNFSETTLADPTVGLSEINSTRTVDPTRQNYYDRRIRDNNRTNYTYNRFSPGTNNKPFPAIDLGSRQSVDVIRLDWYYCLYGADDFRIEANNSNSRNGWTTVADNLESIPIPCSSGSHTQDISVGGQSYRYWRVFIVDGSHPTWNVLSEMEAFSASQPGDIVEQHGSDATNSPGALDFFGDEINITKDGDKGTQSVGLIFDDINTTPESTIIKAELVFVAAQASSGNVNLRVRGVDIDDAQPWVGNYAVDRAVDSDNSDGEVGTTAFATWSPGNWSNGELGEDTAVDVTGVIQEIINRPGWESGNNLALALQHNSGNGARIASRSIQPRLKIDWAETRTQIGDYADEDADGYVDNPTLLEVNVEIGYELFGASEVSSFTTLIRKDGITDD